MINFANWPLYIDYTKDKEGNRYIPSLREFTKQTGIDVNFQEAIQLSLIQSPSPRDA
jgi:hypothetical protein